MRSRPGPVLLGVYLLLIVYASLYPLAGWRDPGGPALGFFGAPWPKYVTGFDLAANVLGYAPFGLLAALVLRPRLSRGAAALLAAAAGAVLSLVLEAAQSYLPARIASNLDVLANAGGAAAGAALALALEPWLAGSGPLSRLRSAAVLPGAAGDLGLALLALWLFAQLNPATLLFGGGDLRDLVAAGGGEGHGAPLFVSIEAAIAAANLAAVLLLAAGVLRPAVGLPRAAGLLGALAAGALAVKTLAFAIVMRAEHVLAWLTPGARIGLAAGAALVLAALWLPRLARLVLAAVLLMAATVLVNTAPPNPYLAEILKVWQQGHFLNFNGLTRVVGALWPFGALGYLIWLAARRTEGPLG